MKKIAKGILIFFVFVFLLGALGGDAPTADDNVSSNTLSTDATMEASEERNPNDLAEQIRKEIAKETVSTPKVVYNEYYKTLVVELHKERSLGPESFRRDMFLDTMDTMIIATNYIDTINEITITGWTNMVDAQGDSTSTKVYQVNRDMTGADTVNWSNLKGAPDMLTTIDRYFESVYWHPGVLR